MAALAQVLDAAELGDFEPSRAWLATVGSTRSAAVRGAMWLAGLEADPPSLEADDTDPHGALASHAFVRWRAILSFDAPLLARTAAALDAFADAGERGTLELGATRLWESIATGAVTEATVEEARELESGAAALGAASLVIELASARALAALDAGDLDVAIESARRASRMAAAEGRPQAQYLANTVLARMRRLSDRPHFSLRILHALRRVASTPWHPWLDWELRLAGDHTTRGESGPHLALDFVLDAARRGDRDAFDEHAEALDAATRGFAPAHRDAHALLFCLDGRRSLDVGSESFRVDAEAWRAGREPMPPNGIQALCLAEPDREADDAVAFVVAEPDGTSHRILQMGLPIVDDLDARFRLAQSSRKRGRVETAAASLLTAGESIDEMLLFRWVYGFAYRDGVHEGVLDVVLHRLRTQLGDHGEVTRHGNEVSLRCHTPLLVPDPRCSQTLDDRVLAQLGRRGRASAQQAADALELPLRTVQRALKRLAAEGLCVKERSGRAVEYRLEDTTFSEPTRH